MVDRDMILTYADTKDQRVAQADRRIDAISKRIEAERNAMESGGVEDALPDVVGDYETLRVDMQIASTAYTRALGGYAASEAEARRQTRYLAPHIQPTMAAEIALPAARHCWSGWSTLFLVARLGHHSCSSTTMCATTTAERMARRPAGQ